MAVCLHADPCMLSWIWIEDVRNAVYSVVVWDNSLINHKIMISHHKQCFRTLVVKVVRTFVGLRTLVVKVFRTFEGVRTFEGNRFGHLWVFGHLWLKVSDISGYSDICG